MGYAVTVFEALHTPGGVLCVRHSGRFRLPKSIVQNEIDNLRAMGVKVMTDMVIGKVVSIDELLGEYGYDAVFIGSGAGLPRFMNIPGENLNGVLTLPNEYDAYQLDESILAERARHRSNTPKRLLWLAVATWRWMLRVVRCVRAPKRCTSVYRRGMEELPARQRRGGTCAGRKEFVFLTLNNPTQILGDENKNVCGIEVVLKWNLVSPMPVDRLYLLLLPFRAVNIAWMWIR